MPFRVFTGHIWESLKEGLSVVMLFQTYRSQKFPLLSLPPGLLELQMSFQGALPNTGQSGLSQDCGNITGSPQILAAPHSHLKIGNNPHIMGMLEDEIS